jgi:hypothetical protein
MQEYTFRIACLVYLLLYQWFGLWYSYGWVKYHGGGRLNKLSELTRVPKQVYIREAIDIALAKHEKRLKRKRKKREG